MMVRAKKVSRFFCLGFRQSAYFTTKIPTRCEEVWLSLVKIFDDLVMLLGTSKQKNIQLPLVGWASCPP
jgi:hypothetical protein